MLADSMSLMHLEYLEGRVGTMFLFLRNSSCSRLEIPLEMLSYFYKRRKSWSKSSPTVSLLSHLYCLLFSFIYVKLLFCNPLSWGKIILSWRLYGALPGIRTFLMSPWWWAPPY